MQRIWWTCSIFVFLASSLLWKFGLKYWLRQKKVYFWFGIQGQTQSVKHIEVFWPWDEIFDNYLLGQSIFFDLLWWNLIPQLIGLGGAMKMRPYSNKVPGVMESNDGYFKSAVQGS